METNAPTLKSSHRHQAQASQLPNIRLFCASPLRYRSNQAKVFWSSRTRKLAFVVSHDCFLRRWETFCMTEHNHLLFWLFFNGDILLVLAKNQVALHSEAATEDCSTQARSASLPRALSSRGRWKHTSSREDNKAARCDSAKAKLRLSEATSCTMRQ